RDSSVSTLIAPLRPLGGEGKNEVMEREASCEGVLQQEIERLVEIDMGNAVAVRAGNARRLEDGKFGEPLAPEAGGRRRYRHDAGKKRMRRSLPSGNPATTSTLRPSITSVPSSVQRIEASAVAAARARAAFARRLGASTRLAINASRWSRCNAGTWSAFVAA